MTAWDVATLGPLARILVQDSIILLRCEARHALDIVDAAVGAGCKANLLSYAEEDQKCLVQLVQGKGLNSCVTLTPRWWTRVLSEKEH